MAEALLSLIGIGAAVLLVGLCVEWWTRPHEETIADGYSPSEGKGLR